MDADSPASVRRRALLGAVWAVPAVQVVSVAPAYAASGAAALTVTLVPPARVFKPLTTQQDLVNVVSTIQNANDQATAALTVIVDVVSDPAARFDFANASAEAGPGFALVESSRPPGIDRRFVFDALEELAGNASVSFTPSIDLDIGSAGTLTITAVPGGAGLSGTATASFL